MMFITSFWWLWLVLSLGCTAYVVLTLRQKMQLMPGSVVGAWRGGELGSLLRTAMRAFNELGPKKGWVALVGASAHLFGIVFAFAIIMMFVGYVQRL